MRSFLGILRFAFIPKYSTIVVNKITVIATPPVVINPGIALFEKNEKSKTGIKYIASNEKVNPNTSTTQYFLSINIKVAGAIWSVNFYLFL